MARHEYISARMNTNPSSPNFRRWFLMKEIYIDSICENPEVLYMGNTRKEVCDYAAKNGIHVDFKDTGRMPCGCKF